MLHSQVSPIDNHPFYTWVNSTAARRIAAGPMFTPADIGKVAWDQDKSIFLALSSVYPATWVQLNLSNDGTETLNVATINSDIINARQIYASEFFQGELHGNASTATKLAAPITIALAGDVVGSMAFDGSSSITISTTIQSNSIVLGVDTTGPYVASGATSGNGLSGSVNTESGVFTVASNATATNTPSTIVFRDATGSFSAGTITATNFIGAIAGEVTGNASTATKLATPRTIALDGDVTGSALFDGSTNITITTTIEANSVALGVDTTGRYVASGATSGNGLTGSSTTEGGTFTVTSNATTENTPSTIVFRDGTGAFSAGTITATAFVGPIAGEVTGNASTATKLATPRTITLAGDVTGSAEFDGSKDITITTVIQANSIQLGVDTTGNYIASLVAGTGVTITNSGAEGTTPTIAIGQPVATSDSPTFADLTVTGNLTVMGTTSTIDSTNLVIADSIIQLARGNSTGVVPFIGLQAERGATDAYWVWDEATDSWRSALSPDGGNFVSADITCDQLFATTIFGNLDGNATTASNLVGPQWAIPYQSATNITSMLSAGAVGQVLTSNGSAAPAWKTPFSLPVATAAVLGGVKDGTGITITADGTINVDYGSTSGTAVQGNDIRVTADQAANVASIRTLGTTATSAAAGNHTHPAYLTSAVTTISFGTTGLTPTAATSGAVTVAGTLAVANGGTGATTAAGALTTLGAYPASNPAGYTTSTGSVNSVSITTANGVSGVSSGGADPALTITLSAITPTTVASSGTADATSTTTGAIKTAGGVSAAKSIWAGGDVVAFSDSRVKTNIIRIPDALHKVTQLNGYTYDRTDMDVPRQTGVLAQEVLAVLPEAVRGSVDTTYGVSYGNMVGLLIEAIKDLNIKIQQLEARLE